MLFLVFVAVIGSCYGGPSTIPLSGENVRADILGMFSYPTERIDSSVENSLYDIKCPPYQVPNIDGSCSIPDITQNVFVYGTPVVESEERPLPKIPKPKIAYNVVVIRSDSDEEKGPIIVPPPQEKTVVYVLKKEKDGKRKVIEVESNNENPEVFFVDYKDGQNFNLPGGIDLETALQYASSGDSDRSRPDLPGPVKVTYVDRAASSYNEEHPKSGNGYVPRDTTYQSEEQLKPFNEKLYQATSSQIKIKRQPKPNTSYQYRDSSYAKEESKSSSTKITRRFPLPRQRYSEPRSTEANESLYKNSSPKTSTFTQPSPTTTQEIPFFASSEINLTKNERQSSFKSLMENKIKSAKVSAHYRLPKLLRNI